MSEKKFGEVAPAKQTLVFLRLHQVLMKPVMRPYIPCARDRESRTTHRAAYQLFSGSRRLATNLVPIPKSAERGHFLAFQTLVVHPAQQGANGLDTVGRWGRHDDGPLCAALRVAAT